MVEPRLRQGDACLDDLDDDQYVGAAKRSDLVCHARTVRRRKELTFTEITATDADGTVVAHAVQTYRLGG